MAFGTSVLLSNGPQASQTTWTLAASGFVNPSFLGGDLATSGTGLYTSDGFQIEQGTSLIVAFEGTYGAVTLFHEQTMDVAGATGWFPVVGYALDNSSSGSGVSTTGVAYAFPTPGVRHRIRVTALASGTLVARASLSSDVAVVAAASLLPTSLATSGFDVATTITRPANQTPYTAGDVVGGALDLGVLGPSAKSILITSAQLELDIAAIPTGMTSFTLYLYSVSPPSALADNAAWDLPSGDRASFLGSVNLGSPVDLGSTLYVEQNGLNKQLRLAGTDLFGYLVTTGGFTPAANSEVYKLTLHTLAV